MMKLSSAREGTALKSCLMMVSSKYLMTRMTFSSFLMTAALSSRRGEGSDPSTSSNPQMRLTSPSLLKPPSSISSLDLIQKM